jgi:phage baseplate assembly protein W
MQVAFPFRVTGAGRTASQEHDAHIRDLIEQVLFTSPGERVNRPDLGCGLLGSVFDTTNDEGAAACQFLVQGTLQQWLGDLIEVEAVEVTSEEATLYVTVLYRIIATQQRAIAKFTSDEAD